MGSSQTEHSDQHAPKQRPSGSNPSPRRPSFPSSAFPISAALNKLCKPPKKHQNSSKTLRFRSKNLASSIGLALSRPCMRNVSHVVRMALVLKCCSTTFSPEEKQKRLPSTCDPSVWPHPPPCRGSPLVMVPVCQNAFFHHWLIATLKRQQSSQDKIP